MHRDAPLALADGLGLPPRVGERDAVETVELSVLGRTADLLLERDPSRVAVGTHRPGVAADVADAGHGQAPGGAIVVELARREPEQQSPLAPR